MSALDYSLPSFTFSLSIYVLFIVVRQFRKSLKYFHQKTMSLKSFRTTWKFTGMQVFLHFFLNFNIAFLYEESLCLSVAF